MFGYFGAKLAAEHVVANSGLPWTTLRATQFHDTFLIVGKQMAKMPFVPPVTRDEHVGVVAGDCED